MKALFQDLKSLDRTIWIRFIGETMTSTAFQMMLPFFALYLKGKGNSMVDVGLIMATAPVAAAFGSMVGGRLADRIGRKALMILSHTGLGFTLLGFLLAENFLSFAVLSALQGVFNSLYHPAASAMVADVTEPRKRAEAYALLRTGWNIGAALGPLIGMLAIRISREIVFVTTACALFANALLVLLLIRETRPETAGKREKAEQNETPSPWKVLFRDYILASFIGAGIVISMSFSQTENMLPVHLDNELSDIFGTNNPFPYLMSLNGLMVVLLQLPIARRARDKSPGPVMLAGAALFGLGLIAIGQLPAWFDEQHSSAALVLGSLLAVYSVYTLGELIMAPIQMTFVANLAPEQLRGTYMGAAGLQWILGDAIGPLVGGWFLDRSLGHLLYSLLGLGCITSGFVYLALDRWARRKPAKKVATERAG
jgi:MFS family permease